MRDNEGVDARATRDPIPWPGPSTAARAIAEPALPSRLAPLHAVSAPVHFFPFCFVCLLQQTIIPTIIPTELLKSALF